MQAGMEERLLSHDKQLIRVETILERVANNQDGMTTSIASIARSLDKLSNMEGNNEDSFKRVHERIDKEVNIRETKIDSINKKFVPLEIFIFIGKYPKIFVFVMLLISSLYISDVRDVIAEKFKEGKAQ